MVHRLDVRAVRVEHVAPVIARVIRPLTRSAVVAATRLDCSGVEAVYGFAIGRLERDVQPRRGRPVVADEELVGRKPALSFGRNGEAKRSQRARIEPLTRLDIRNAKVDVVKEPARMRLRHGFKYMSTCCSDAVVGWDGRILLVGQLSRTTLYES